MKAPFVNYCPLKHTGQTCDLSKTCPPKTIPGYSRVAMWLHINIRRHPTTGFGRLSFFQEVLGRSPCCRSPHPVVEDCNTLFLVMFIDLEFWTMQSSFGSPEWSCSGNRGRGGRVTWNQICFWGVHSALPRKSQTYWNHDQHWHIMSHNALHTTCHMSCHFCSWVTVDLEDCPVW